MPSAKYPRVSVIGAGAVGSTLSRALFEKGYPIVSVISRSGTHAIALAKSVKCKKASTQIADIAEESDVIIIAVSDGAVASLAKLLAGVHRLKFKKLFVFHTSGVLSSTVLDPLRKKGASVASIHPIQTFPSSRQTSVLKGKLKGIYYGVEGNHESIPRAERIVGDLGGKSVLIDKDMKPLYHVACVFASGYMMTILNVINELARQLKLKASWTEVFGPLMTTAMENTIHYSAGEALTGPILRNDVATIEAHLSVLAAHAPQFLPLYTIHGIEVGRIAKGNHRITQKDFDGIVTLFREFVKQLPTKKTKR